VSLSKLELIGFKSFMAPVTLDFREGITAILGPNGCGKTNIVDAVRWVLGEQSARQLRGAKMENVIFNGTEVHKPLGYAVVNLTVDNARGVFPIDYSEITITRKVYRSGISEYFINKSPCRLKDLRELFADTGSGSHSYSVIEQEMIDYVLNDAHGERRYMFEEAAGIVKYRMRCEEAQRKLKLTEGDLIRLDDIMEELDKQVRSLRYQMGKAKRYQTIQTRIKQWELVGLRRQLGELLAIRSKAAAKLDEMRTHSSVESTAFSEVSREVDDAKIQLVELEKRQTELQNLRYEVRRKIQTSEERVIQFTERSTQANRRIDQAGDEVVEARKRLESIAAKMETAFGERDAVTAEIGREERTIHGMADALRAVNENITAHKERLIVCKQTQLDFLQDQARVRNSLEHYESIRSKLDAQAAEVRDDVSRFEGEASEYAAEMNRCREEIDRLQDALADYEREREGTLSSIIAIEERIADREQSRAAVKAELARIKSRHELFLRMQEEFEGYPAGARHILQRGDRRIKGPLAELITIDEKFRPALEAVLGGILDGVVVERFSDAVELVTELARETRGRVRLFVEESGRSENRAAADGAPGYVGVLSDQVEVVAAQRALVDTLLGDVCVFDTVEHALQYIGSAAGGAGNAVTLGGIFFCGGKGIYFSGAPGEEVSLLARSEEIVKMAEAIDRCQGEYAGLEAECETGRRDKEQARTRVTEIDAAISGVRRRLEEKSEELAEASRGHATRREKCSLLLKSLDEIETTRSTILSKIEETRLSLDLKEKDGEHAESVRLEEELASLQGKRDGLDADLTERKVALASQRGALEKTREEIRGLEEMQREFTSIVEQRTGETASLREELETLAGDIERERGIVRDLIEQENAYQGEIDQMNGTLEQRRSEIVAMEKELKAKQAERDRIVAQENELKITLSSTGTRMQDLIDRARDVHGEDFACYLNGEELPLDEEERMITPEMLERERRTLAGFGPVNLAAVDEYEEKKTRLDFLISQKEDLEKARDELEEGIRTINARARKKFVETFEQVRGHFTETFAVLFEGGEANLSLSEGSDPLEADIVISARPKGKRLQDIALLSGGERALTALALLFALYQAKPSPFCILDEVDAPLDDANIQRFVRMLQRFQTDTQFIIITHNKRTMEVAEMLYGVTMEEKGVSSVVSVDLMDIEQVMENRGPATKPLVEAPVSTN
jgi:chromosome segregation protein